MTRYLRIADSGGAPYIWDLLTGDTSAIGSNLRVDLASMVLNPLEAGLWEMTYRVFGSFPNNAQLMNLAIAEVIDPMCYQINRYAEKPGSTPQTWIYEKNEGEATPVTPPFTPTPDRRAILVAASFQPVAEGSVGALMIHDGFVGLLRLTRKDWEDRTVSAYEEEVTLNPSLIASVVEKFAISVGGSLNARIRQAGLSLTNSTIYKYTIGFRHENTDTSIYQPVGNMGAGILDKDGNTPSNWPGGPGEDYEMTPYAPGVGYTWPEDQANPTYMGYKHIVGGGVYVHYLRLEEITLENTDTYNNDYVGDYEVFIRMKIPNGVDGTDAYYSAELGFGDSTSALSFNDPVYIKRSSNTDWMHLSLGRMTLPTSPYTSALSEDGSSFFLSRFTIAVRTKIIGDILIDDWILVDSVFLMPAQNYTVTNAEGVDSESITSIYLTYGESPTGDSGILATSPYQQLEFSGSPYLEPGNSNIVLLKRIVPDVVTNTATLTLEIIEKYLTSRYTS